MFDALGPDDLLAAIGRVLRSAAQADGPLDDYARSQLLSAYSICRFLAPEISAVATLSRLLREQLVQILAGSDDPVLCTIANRVEADVSGVDATVAAAEVLERCRQVPTLHLVREQVRRALAGVVNGYVDALDGAPR